MTVVESEPFPSGVYECPKCGNHIEVFVPLKESPIHRCPGAGKAHTMVYKGKNSRRTSASRDSVG